MPVGKSQGTFYTCCVSPWSLNPCLLPVCMWARWFARLCMSPYSPLWADTERTQIKRHQHVEMWAKHYKKVKCCSEELLTSFSIPRFCYWVISLSFPVWYVFYHPSNINLPDLFLKVSWQESCTASSCALSLPIRFFKYFDVGSEASFFCWLSFLSTNFMVSRGILRVQR